MDVVTATAAAMAMVMVREFKVKKGAPHHGKREKLIYHLLSALSAGPAADYGDCAPT